MHQATNTVATFVHYKGAAPELLDLVAGRIQAASTTLIGAQPLLKSGKVKALAVLNDRRSPLLPDVGTIAEQGIPGYNYASWLGFIAPAATPAATIARLNEAFVKVVRLPEVTGKLAADGSSAVGSTAQQFRELIALETERWRSLVQATGITLGE